MANAWKSSPPSQPSPPVVALTLGDPAGIGAELVARLLDGLQSAQHTTPHARVLLVGDPWLWQAGQRIAGVQVRTHSVGRFEDAAGLPPGPIAFLPVSSVQPQDVQPAQAGAAGGKSVLHVLNLCMDAALRGEIDAICFAPLNKQAMKMGGLAHSDELHHFAQYLGVKNCFCEFNTLGDLWTARISSHIPLKEAAQHVTQARILDAAQLIYQSLLASGVPNPKIAIAGFNPHNGDGGTCGREEIDTIIPAVQTLQSRAWPTPEPFHGPFPADTIFLKARAGEYQAIVTMYHDQGQIAIKLMGFERGVTVQGGLPIPITTPAHGTAYDIAGQGRANPQAMRAAFLLAARMGQHHQKNHAS